MLKILKPELKMNRIVRSSKPTTSKEMSPFSRFFEDVFYIDTHVVPRIQDKGLQRPVEPRIFNKA